MKSYYTLLFHPYDGGYLVTVPDVPGCSTGGKSIPEAIEVAKDALCGCLCVYEDEDVALPAPRMPQEIQLEPGDFTTLIEVDTLKYREETDTRAVRKMSPCLRGCWTWRTRAELTARRCFRTL